jgi:hypothetical protein
MASFSEHGGGQLSENLILKSSIVTKKEKLNENSPSIFFGWLTPGDNMRTPSLSPLSSPEKANVLLGHAW